MAENKLGKIIKESKRITKTRLNKMLEHAPYSQVLQKLMADKEKNADFAMMQYAWNPQNEDKAPEDVVVIDTVDLKTKKESQKSTPKKQTKTKGKPAAKKTQISRPISETEIKTEPAVDGQELEKPPVSVPKSNAEEASKTSQKQTAKKTQGKSSTKLKPTKKSQSKKPASRGRKQAIKKVSQQKASVELDDFTQWLNSLKNEGEATQRTKPKKRKSKRKKDPIQNIIDDSVRSKDEIATESLAQLYESQEYYDKAIEVYEKLSLKFPEKSGFFASQIEKLKDKI